MAKTITLRRNRKGQFVRASNPRPHRKHRKHRSNYVSAGSVVPLMNRRRKGYRKRRHNPPQMLSLAGSLIPPIDTLAGVTAGLIGPSIVTGVVAQMSPTTAASYPTALKIGSNAAVLFGGYLLGGRKGLRDVAIGEVSAFLAQQIAAIVRAWAPAGTMQGYVRQGQMHGYTGAVPRVGATGLGRARHAISRRQNVAQFPARANRFQSRFRRLIP